MNIIKIEEVFVVVCLAILILLVFFAALFRWFGVSVAWSLDVAQMMFAWVTFIGADLALRKSKHIGVDILITRLPPVVQKAAAFVCYALMLLFLSIVVFYGMRLCIENYQRYFYTLPLSYSYVTGAAPVGSFLMIITVLKHVIKLCKPKNP
ncbi:MAG: TRAP transporter small permease [Spirochaetales bacterium]|jgi:TRAP-type C4-dicarboxylate transport system permease small subunit|nr:TRAP transporter small permease [Spirochaetales bacterium]